MILEVVFDPPIRFLNSTLSLKTARVEETEGPIVGTDRGVGLVVKHGRTSLPLLVPWHRVSYCVLAEPIPEKRGPGRPRKDQPSGG